LGQTSNLRVGSWNLSERANTLLSLAAKNFGTRLGALRARGVNDAGVANDAIMFSAPAATSVTAAN